MDIISCEAKLNETNKFYWFLSSIKDTVQNETFINLLKAVLPHIKEDVNKPIIKLLNTYDNSYSRSFKFIITSPSIEFASLRFDSNSTWGTDLNKEVFKLLTENGMDFTHKNRIFGLADNNLEGLLEDFKNGANENPAEIFKSLSISEPFLNIDEGFVDEDKYISLLKIMASQLPQSEFIKRISDAELLQQATYKSASKIVEFLVNEINVPINTICAKGKTSLMYCRTESMLDLFADNKQVDWFMRDSSGNDCLYYFGRIPNKEISKSLIKKAQDCVKIASEGNVEYQSIIDESNKKALLGMVTSGKNKKEIDDFIRSTKIKNFNGIVDDKGRSMAQIVLLKDEWGKFETFKKGYNQNHRDKRGYSNLEYILSKNNPKYESKAVNILETELKSLGSDTGFNMLNRFLRISRPFYVPKWYVNKGNHESFYKCFQPNASESDLEIFYEAVKSNPMYTSLHTVNPDIVNSISTFAKPYFLHAKDNGYQDKIVNLDLSKVFKITPKKSNFADHDSYSVSTEGLINMLAIRNLIVENYLDVDQFDKHFDSQAISYLTKGRQELFGENTSDRNYAYDRESFIRNSMSLLNVLIDINSSQLINILDDSYVEDIKKTSNDREVLKKIDVYLLQNQLEAQKPQANATKRFKI